MAITKQEVIEFGKTVVMDTSGFRAMEYVMVGIACFFGILAILFYVAIKKGNDFHGSFFASFTIMLLCIIFSFLIHELPTKQEEQEFNAKKNEWKYEYVIPYIETLPVQTEKNIKTIKIDYLLEEQSFAGDYFTTGWVDAKPFTIVNKDEKVYHVWANVVVDEKITEPYLEYQYQDEDFSEDYPSREYNYVLYVNKEIGR